MAGSIPAGNIHLSAAIMFSGASFTKLDKVLKALNVQTICSSTYYSHAQQYLQPTIISLWQDTQSELLLKLSSRTGDLIIGGDMRADSPGHCAKYGSYTVVELRSNKVIDIQLVQVGFKKTLIMSDLNYGPCTQRT